MIATQRVIEAVSRLTGVSVEDLKNGRAPVLGLPNSMDSLDRTELFVELESEFDQETLRWAIRYIETLAESRCTRRAAPRQLDNLNPLWDREIDG